MPATPRRVQAFLPSLAVALATFGLAFNDGTFANTDRYAVAVVLWWGLMLGVLLALWPATRVPRPALVAGGALAAFCVLTALSIAWSVSAETAFDEFTRVAAYLGAFVVAVAIGTRGNAGRLVDGLALGLVALSLLALAARLFPDWIDAARPEGIFQGDPRATWPVGYWNALAVLAAMALPLLLRAAVISRRRLAAAIAVAPAPALAALIYLTDSRTGVITAAIALLAFLALTHERGRALTAIAIGGAGSAAAVLLLKGQSAILDSPYTSSDATSEGRVAALVILALCVVAGLVYAVAAPRELRLPQLSRRVKVGLAVGLGVLVVGGVALADPGERLDEFKKPPPELGTVDTGHLTSIESSGRYQLWSSAVDEWQDHPVVGGGAGSYEAWWAQHGDLSHFVRSAHSVYFESLAELGVVGLILILVLLATAAVAVRRRLKVAEGPETATIAAVAAFVLAFAVAVGADWTWDLTVIPALGMFGLGLLTGPATEVYEPQEAGRRRRRLPRLAFAVVALVIVAAQALPLMVQRRLDDSREAAARGDVGAALDDADDARSWQPWAASPYLQLALVHEQAAALPDAEEAIDKAIARSDHDWRLWLVKSRVQTSEGDVTSAGESFDRALELSPRSRLLNSLARPGSLPPR